MVKIGGFGMRWPNFGFDERPLKRPMALTMGPQVPSSGCLCGVL